MGYIFISYSHKDKIYARKLRDALQSEGFDVWNDDRIGAGAEWPRTIQTQLDGCEAFIVLVSENAFESKWVQNEVARAGRKGKPVFPLLLQGDPWLAVEATQYVDVSDGSLPSEEFYNLLSAYATRKPKDRPVLPRTEAGRQYPRRKATVPRIVIAVAIFLLIFAILLGVGNFFGPALKEGLSNFTPVALFQAKPTPNSSLELSVTGAGIISNESVVIRNTTENQVSLNYWRVNANGSHIYSFPNVTLLPKGTIRLNTATGINTSTALYMNLGRPLFHSGDSVTLVDGNNHVRASFQIP